MDGSIFNWVQPRFEFFWKIMQKNKNKKRNKCFTNSTIFTFTSKKHSAIKTKTKQLKKTNFDFETNAINNGIWFKIQNINIYHKMG